MTPAEIIAARAPDIATADATRIPTLVSIATDETGSGYGSRRSTAIALLVLHWIVSDARGGAGEVTSEKTGDLQRSYAASDGTTDLSSTSWGRELERLKRTRGFALPQNRMVT